MDCAICLSKIKNEDSVWLQCEHVFHRDCLYQIKTLRCPLCREKIDTKRVFGVENMCNGEYHEYSPFVKNGPCRICYKSRF